MGDIERITKDFLRGQQLQLAGQALQVGAFNELLDLKAPVRDLPFNVRAVIL